MLHTNIAARVDNVLERAAGLVPFLREAARRTEVARQISDETVSRIRDAGLLQVLVPSAFGGHEFDLATTARLIAELGRGCGSTAWVYGVSALQNWVVATFPAEVQEEVWSRGPATVISGTYGSDPKAQSVRRVKDGYRLSGRWGFASGCDHAEWHLAQILVDGEGSEPPTSHFALVPRKDFVIEDDWYVMGLAGTGSKTVILDDVFVPDRRTLSYASMDTGKTQGGALHSNGLYRLPLMSVVTVGLAAAVVGVARGALESLIDAAASGMKDSSRGRFAEHTLAHAWIGQAIADIDASQLALFGSLEKLNAIAKSGRDLTVEERVKLRLHYAFAVRMSVEASELILKCNGASGAALTQQSQRAWRDINTAARHIGLNWEPYAIQSGRLAVGLPPNGLF